MIALWALALASAQLETILTIDPRHRLVEGIATDGTTIWVSSVLDRTILACTKSCRRLAQLPRGLHPLGIAWDPRRKRLWVAADCPKLPGVDPCERGSLVALDKSGQLRTRIGPGGNSFHPGDVSASAAGVFVSDSSNGAVYRVGASGQSLSPIVEPGLGTSAQGSVLDPTGERLIIADYNQGLVAVERRSGKRTLLPDEDGAAIRGIDGLVRCGGGFVGVYNGSAQGKLVAITLREGGVSRSDLIEGLQLPDSTQIAFDGSRLLIVSNAGWPAATRVGGVRSEGASIIAIPVDGDCKVISPET